MGKLIIVGTPIGNLDDLTPRAVQALKECDFIIAEDTRVTAVLLAHTGISKKIFSSNGFTEETKAEGFIKKISEGCNAVLVTDAGMPCISDPGYKLIGKAAAAGIEVTVCPGASASVAAVALSGLPCPSFGFYGFLPRKKGDCSARLKQIASDSAHLAVFYESPNRIIETLEIMKEVFPEANAAVCNDITKKFEKVYRGTLSQVCGELAQNPKNDKGEYTIGLEKNSEQKEESPFSPEAYLIQAMIDTDTDIKQAITFAAEKYGVPKKQLYAASLRLKELFALNKTNKDK